LLGIALIAVMNHPLLEVIYRSAAIIICAWTIRYLAIGWHTAATAFRTVDPDLIDAARLCGASSWAIFRHVRLPQIVPKLALGWYVVYLLCLWDVETLILILPPGGETLAVRIFGLLHYGHNTQVNALCLLLVALALAPLLAWRALEHARRLIKGVPAALCLTLLIAAGCGQKTGTAPMSSRLFRAVEVIGHRGAGAGEFNKPRSIAIDRSNNLYVADMTGRVQKFSPDGKFLLSWQMPETDLGKPKGMCLDRDGNIIVLEPHYQRVNHFSPDGKLMTQWGKRGTNRGEMMLPRSVAVNSHGDIFLPEYKDVERIQGFSGQDKRPVALIGKPGTADGEFNRAEGIDIDAQDRIYVADSCNHRIQIFAPNGNWLRAYGRAGNNAGEMSYPYDIRVDRDGRQYVCEFGNSRVQIFDPQDQPLELLGGPGATPGQFNNPWSIALDSQGNLYVCDTGNHRVQKFIRK
jgi:sugar lactone lactonase YvrE